MSDIRPSEELRAKVLAMASAEPSLSRGDRVRRDAMILVAGFLPSVALSIYLGGPNIGDRPSGYVLGLATAWLIVGVLATLASVSRGGSMLGHAASLRLAGTVLTPVGLLVTAFVASALWPQTLNNVATMQGDITCVVVTLACAVGPLVAFAFLRRGSEPVLPRLTGAGIGAAAGAWGALAIELHCVHASMQHIVVGHLLPVALLTVIGIVIGQGVLAVRATHE